MAILGDCLEAMGKIEDCSIDLIFCDLPYGTTQAKWDSRIDLQLLWKHYERIMKPNCAILLTAQIPYSIILGYSKIKWLRYEWILEKTAATGHYNAKKMPMKAHENLLVFYKKLPVYNPIKTEGHEPVNSFTKYIETQNKTELYGISSKQINGGGSTERYPRSIQTFKSDKQSNYIFSVQKPVEMVEYFIKTYSQPGALVLDNCAGSFALGEACMNCGRNFILIEADEDIFNKGNSRLREIVKKF